MSASRAQRTMSASACAPETAQGTHLFKIDGYSLCRGLGVGKSIQSAVFRVGKSIQSAVFRVGGHDWCVYFYPDGIREDSKDYVSVFLELKTQNAEARALYHLRVVDQAWPPPPFTWPIPSQYEPLVFNSTDDDRCWGYTHFMRKTKLWSYVLEDTLILECNLAVIELKDAQEANVKISFEAQAPLSELVHNLSSLLEATEGSDVSFKVKEEVFPAHKIILAMRSPVFKVKFYGSMRDESSRSITVEDMQPAVFRGLLHFIYTDSLPPLDYLDDDEYEEMVRHLLVAADRYAMERMKYMCEIKLCELLHTGTVATTLALADQHHCSKLKDACIGFINSSNRMVGVMESKGYESLKRTCPFVIADILEKAVKTRRI
ncbi:BTB/POZ and MATH domain-containing protein 1-like [Triticum dicoccoides]|uniref:BTB/POZ and MATH domain-containing protein 1-like n=1 Tax=Triticum dicoccoides TaxID=85692 RepID=UPI00188E2431|nr:BTB/POZ and MATH domain-containing protein 1-like [Triticum dicoccoides]